MVLPYKAVAYAIGALHLDLAAGYTLAAPGGAATRVVVRGATPVMADAATRTGTSYLPADAVERAKEGNPIEKAKIAKDGTNAFTDVRAPSMRTASCVCPPSPSFD